MSLLKHLFLTSLAMYLSLSSEVLISLESNTLRLTSIQGAKVRSSWKMLTDTAEITVPRLFKIDNRDADIRDFLVPGTSIELRLGYNEDLYTEFSGYITGWEGTGPIKLECEDEMFQLKKPNFNKAFYKTPLQDLVDFIAPDVTTNVQAVNIGDFLIKNATAVQVLKELSELPYNIFSYFPIGSKTMKVGFPYQFKSNERYLMHLQRNVKTGDGLNYRNIDQDSIQIRVISHLDNGQVIETIYPRSLEGASQRTLNVMNIESVNELVLFAQAERAKFNFSGYEGSLTGFGIPVIRHGDEIELIDERYPERAGVYLVDEVITEFNVPSASFQRVLNMGLKV